MSKRLFEPILGSRPDYTDVMPIRVKQLDPQNFEVTVEARQTTTHRVSASEDYVRQLAGEAADAAALVEKSFEFLLEREPNTSILRSFDLKVIQSYFPEYEKTIAERL